MVANAPILLVAGVVAGPVARGRSVVGHGDEARSHAMAVQGAPLSLRLLSGPAARENAGCDLSHERPMLFCSFCTKSHIFKLQAVARTASLRPLRLSARRCSFLSSTKKAKPRSSSSSSSSSSSTLCFCGGRESRSPG